jgi:hypothetical protein
MMKELVELESWANRIVTNEAVQDRPLARNQDIQYQASRKYPDRSPEQALNLYVADKMNDNDSMNLNQNKLINAQKRENEKLSRTVQELGQELHDHERIAQDTGKELDRLKQLSAQLKPAGEIQQQVAKASADKVQGMLDDLRRLENKPGIDDVKFKELSDKINKIKSQPVDNKEISKIQSMLSSLDQRQSVDDGLFNKVMSRLETTERELAEKEKRFQTSIKKSKDKVSQMGAQYAPLANDIKDMQQKMDQIKSTSEVIFRDLDAKTVEAERAAKKLNIIMPHVKNILAQPGSAEPTTNNVVRLKPQQRGGPDLSAFANDDNNNVAVNEDIRTSDVEYKNWLKNNTPVVVKMFKRRFPNINNTYNDDQIVDQIQDNLIYLYRLEEVTQKIMNDFLDVIYYNLEEEGPDPQQTLFTAADSLNETYERMLDTVIGLPEIFKKH